MILPLAIVLLPLTSITVAESRFGSLTLIVGSLLVVLTIIAIANSVATRSFPATPATIAGVILAPLMVLSFVASPSGKGAILTVFAVVAAGVTLTIATLRHEDLERSVAVPLLVTSSVQSILVIAQTLTDRAIGLSLIEPGAELQFIDGLLRSQGTMRHVYEPAALALLAGGVAVVTTPEKTGLRYLWIAAAGLAGTTIGLTHSRAALLGFGLLAIFLVVAMARRYPGVTAVGGALLLGFAVATVLTASAWALRGDHSTTGDLDDASLGRVTLAKQAVQMAADNPVVGVGPGLYLDTMRSDYELDERYPFVVHNVSLAVAAENGFAAAVLASFFVAWAVVRAVRSDPVWAMLAVAPTGFLLFDVLHYDRPVGLLMTGIWLGLLHHAGDQPAVTSRRVKSS